MLYIDSEVVVLRGRSVSSGASFQSSSLVTPSARVSVESTDSCEEGAVMLSTVELLLMLELASEHFLPSEFLPINFRRNTLK